VISLNHSRTTREELPNACRSRRVSSGLRFVVLFHSLQIHVISIHDTCVALLSGLHTPSMSGNPPRQRVIDDTDPDIQYGPNGWALADPSTLNVGNFGPIFQGTSHAAASNTTLSYTFNGTLSSSFRRGPTSLSYRYCNYRLRDHNGDHRRQ
jgi:hypothetical protein